MTLMVKMLEDREVLLVRPDGRVSLVVNPQQLWEAVKAARGCSWAWTTPQAGAAVTDWIAERQELRERARNHEAMDMKDLIAKFEREHGVTRVRASAAVGAPPPKPKPKVAKPPKLHIDVAAVLALLQIED